MSVSSRSSSVEEFVRYGVDWWIKELANLLPDRFWQWLTDAGERCLVITLSGENVGLRLCDGRKRALAETSIERNSDPERALRAFLKSHHLPRSEVRLGLALPIDAFFCREIRLPREVGRLFPDIARKDLLQHTPFREEDIHYDYAAEHSGAHITVRQYVIRRSFVSEAILDLGMEEKDFSFIESPTDDGVSVPFQLRLSHKEKHRRWPFRTLLLLTASFITMLAAAAIITHERQNHQLDGLNRQIKDFQTQAQEVRAAIEAISQEQQVRGALDTHMQSVTSVLDVWEEVSRLLPDHSWVQELRFLKPQDGSDYKLTLSGLSASAAKLVEVLDQSPRFSDVKLTAPISADPVEKRERFVLEAQIVPDKSWQEK